MGNMAMKGHVILAAALAATSVCVHADVEHVCAVGGTETFKSFLRTAAGGGADFASPDCVDALPLDSAVNTLFVIAPKYESGESVCPPFNVAQIAAMAASLRRGNRFYVENVRSESAASVGFLGVATFGGKAAPFARRIVESDCGLLQFRCGGYMPAALDMSSVWGRAKVIASVSDALGVNAVFRPAQERGPVVAVSADGRRVFSAIGLSACPSSLFMRPRGRWRAFHARLFAGLLGRDEAAVAAAFDAAWPQVLSDSGKRPPDDVVKKALAWHENSGILFAPDGTKGMREAVASDDFGWRGELRTDSNFMTGALFAWAGKIYGRPEWVRFGRNLADNILSRGNLTDEGYFRWLDREAKGDGKYHVYATDHGRSTLACANLYEVTRDERYLAAAKRAADAFLAWQSDDGLVTLFFDLRKQRVPVKGHSENPVCYYDNVPALFKIAELTGERKYADAALRCVKTMSGKFPNFDFGPGYYSANSIYGRYLLIAAAAQRATDADFSKSINGVLDFYEKNQHPRGGIAEIKIRLVLHDEGGVGIGDGSDHIADLLYCNNFSFAALSILMKLPPEKVKGIDIARARRIYAKLRDFLAETQISSSVPTFDGAWMRAYDMDVGEWHGLEKDAGWGPYCIETGWTMGTIPAVFLFDGRPGSYF